MAEQEIGERGWLHIPAIRELASLKQWVVWGAREGDSYPRKAPRTSIGTAASVDDPRTWDYFGECFSGCVQRGLEGLGFVLTEADDLIGVDLDHCRVGSDGLTPWAEEIVRELNTYTEWSPGDGVHCWGRARVPFKGRRKGPVEVYFAGRYLTVTAQPWGDSAAPIRDITDKIPWLIEKFIGSDSEPDTQESASIEADNKPIEIRANAEPPAEKFGALLLNNLDFNNSFYHRRKDFVDQSLSAYDMSIATIAAQAGWERQEIANLIISHRANHGDAGKAFRRDYIERTVERAMRGKGVGVTEKAAVASHAVEERRESSRDEALTALSQQLALEVVRVVQRGRDPASYSLETARFGTVHIGGTDILLSATKARGKLINTSGLYIPQMSKKAWEVVIEHLVLAAEFEATDEGERSVQNASWLDQYLAGPLLVAESEQQLDELWLRNQFPVEYRGHAHLRLNEYKAYLLDQHGERLSSHEVAVRLREAGMEPTIINTVDGVGLRHQRRAWRRPVRAASDAMTSVELPTELMTEE